MPAKKSPTASQRRRSAVLRQFGVDERVWLAHEEQGFFCAPRTLPIVLLAMGEKNVSGSLDPSKVYLDLLANHMGQGVVELESEDVHAFACGYSAPKAWRERMKALELAGFIRTIPEGNRTFGWVILRHPNAVMHELQSAGKVPANIWNAYVCRAMETGEMPTDPAPATAAIS